MSNYNKYPQTDIKGFEKQAFQGYENVVKELKSKLQGDNVLVIDCYPGVRYTELLNQVIKPLNPSEIIFSDDVFISGEEITCRIEDNLTDDRVFGVLSTYKFEQFVNATTLKEAKAKLENAGGLKVVYGVGATVVTEGDVLIYADLARWEIQQRYRSQELGNWKMTNYDEDILRKYKRGFFVEWRMADRHKKSIFNKLNYFLDTNIKDEPKMITNAAFFEGIRETVKGPFRVVPFFDPGVWGGQWMKDVCDLDKSKDNFAWCFDCVPEENSLFVNYGDVRVEMPSINVVFLEAVNLLGDSVHARFGTEFPIRFDFLDTMGGQNLSLQVHPLTEYIQDRFGMHYTQDESYYILDAKEGANVYLGVKEGVKPEEMIDDLRKAQTGDILFDDEKYINKFPAKKHDHFLIPAGTVHCSGENTMVLEISATPYIFTFKLWDWARLGLDGLPRPVHVEHGKEVIQFDRDTKWVEENLVNNIQILQEKEDLLEERTGLHSRQFIETRRTTFNEKISFETKGSVNVLNLVEGSEAIVESPNNSFEPYVVHYAETFIVPENVKSYTIRPYGKSEGELLKILRAYVRL